MTEFRKEIKERSNCWAIEFVVLSVREVLRNVETKGFDHGAEVRLFCDGFDENGEAARTRPPPDLDIAVQPSLLESDEPFRKRTRQLLRAPSFLPFFLPVQVGIIPDLVKQLVGQSREVVVDRRSHLETTIKISLERNGRQDQKTH